MTSRLTLRLALITALVPATALPAAAQSSDRTRFSVAAGAGASNLLHGDFDFVPTTWQVDARLHISRYFALEAFFEEWRHTDEDTWVDQVLTGPTGPIGHADRITTSTRHSGRTVGWNALGLAPLGRVTLFGGGGVGALLYERERTQSVVGCTSTVPTACGNPETRSQHDSTSFTAQLQGGLDVAIASWVAATGQVRAVIPVRDPGFGHVSYTGGVRFRF